MIQIEMLPIDAVREYDRNPRTIGDDAVAAVARSIEQFGFKVPVIVDVDGVLIAGHTRLRAARKLGLTTVPAVRASDLTPDQARALRLADNQVATLAEWNMDLLAIELDALRSIDVDLASLGFDEDELAKIFAGDMKDGLTDPDDVPAPPDAATTQPGDLWVLGDHRLLCGDSSKPEDVDRLLGGQPIHLVNTDPPYNVKVEPRSNNAIAAGLSSFEATHHQKFDKARNPDSKATHKKLRAKDRPLANDFVTDEAFDALLDAWFGNMARVLLPGRGFYIWGGYANLGNYPPYLKKHELYFSQGIVWDKQHPVLTRKDYMGAFELCQPAETAVLTPDGEVPIASLRDGDKVVGYTTRHHRLTGRQGGQRVRRAVRPYIGDMLGVVAGMRQTWATPGHIWSARLVPNADEWWCVYLMRRGRWWRVGKSRLINTWGFGLKSRVYAEGGDGAWVLSVHRTNAEALVAEQTVAAVYGVPLTVWWRRGEVRTRMGDPHALYDCLDLDSLERCAARALADHGRAIEYPCVTAERKHEKISRRVPFRVRTCNLLPSVMLVPRPASTGVIEWVPVDAIERTPYRGTVHSLDVQPSGHYIADGIVTHNCFYGWREGAAHLFLGPNNATDLWHVKKIPPQQMEHLTAKPAELAVRAMQYSSRAGENVLDLFGGSGSTLIGAEQTGRRAFLMELDPLYCDTICDRYQRFTGKHAVLERTGESPIPMRAREEAMR